MKTNFHAHTHYCRHSTNDLETLIKLAIDEGYTHFGISEHMPLKYIKQRNPTYNELVQLIKEFKSIKLKYNNQINLYFGLECEYHEELHNEVEEFFNSDDIDYLIFGNHFYESCKYEVIFMNHVDDKLKMIESHIALADLALGTNMFSCYNHPDIFIRSYGKWDEVTQIASRKIIDIAIKYDVPLEFNLNGLSEKLITHKNTMYPVENFWREVSKTKAKVIIGVDTHEYDLMNNEYREIALQLIDQWGITKNLIETIEFKK